MTCCQYYPPDEGGESIVQVNRSAVKIGPAALRELGDDAKVLQLTPDPMVESTAAFSPAWLADQGAGAVPAVVQASLNRMRFPSTTDVAYAGPQSDR